MGNSNPAGVYTTREKQQGKNEILAFEKLTPARNVAINTYSKALDYAFGEDDVRNIAVTGVYGSGKSSIIESYEEKHKELRFIHLSLAHFEDEGDKGERMRAEEDVRNNADIRTIEGKLINQLIHQINKENIPETNFSIKQDVDKKKYRVIAFFVCVAIALVYYNIYYASWNKHVVNMRDGWIKAAAQATLSPYFRFFAFFLFVFVIGYVIWAALYYLAGKKHLRKISIKGNEIEIFNENKDSYFDRYLNEVLYLFEHANVDAVVFDDIDRFNNSQVFERLREINSLLHTRQIYQTGDNSKPIRFLYLIRDDLFNNNINKDRTKFFDFVIPVVPAVDSSNSYDMLHHYLKEAGIIEQFDIHFLRDISLYIDDLRMLKNIYNEFLIYRTNLDNNRSFDEKSKLDNNKLFAIIAYKNIFPRDFAELQMNNGFLYTLFSKKKDIIQERLAELNKEHDSIIEKIMQCENEPAGSITELDYLKNNFRPHLPTTKQRQEWDAKYEQRRIHLEASIEQVISDYKKQGKKIDDQIAVIEHCKMADLLTADCLDDIFKVFSVNEIGEKEEFNYMKASPYFPLLKYLVSKGYIDELYFDYMSYCYDGALSIRDKQYVRGVMERNALPYHYHLDSPELILELQYLDDYDFTQIETLNYDMFEYILRAKKEKAVKNSIALIKDNEAFDFIDGFIHSRKPIDEMVVAINREWPEMFENAADRKVLSGESILVYCYKALETSDEKTFEDDDKWQRLRKEISNFSGFLAINLPPDVEKRRITMGMEQSKDESEISDGEVSRDPMTFKAEVYNLEKIKKGLAYLGVSFVKINYNWANAELFDFVYRNNLYEINADNIKMMLEKKSGHTPTEEVLYAFMSFVLQSNDIPFCKYISSQLQKAMTVYLGMYSGAICDADSVIVEVLNHKEIEDELKEEYIKRLIPKVKHLNKVENPDIQALLLKNNKIEYTIENMLNYYNENGFDENLISFVNSGDGTVDIDTDDVFDDFMLDFYKCNEVEDAQYMRLVQAYNANYELFDIQNISYNHMSILIKSRIILMNQVNLVFMRSNYADNVLEFILENRREYMELVKGGEYNIAEVKQLLERKELNYNYKLELAKQSGTYIPISGMRTEDSVKEYILTCKLDIADLPWFMENYKQESRRIKDCIFAIMKEHIDETVQDADSMCYALRIRVFASDEIDRTDKIRILEVATRIMSNDEIIKNLRCIQLDSIADKLEGGKNWVVVNAENTKVLDALVKHKIIQPVKLAADKKHYKGIRFMRQ